MWKKMNTVLFVRWSASMRQFCEKHWSGQTTTKTIHNRPPTRVVKNTRRLSHRGMPSFWMSIWTWFVIGHRCWAIGATELDGCNIQVRADELRFAWYKKFISIFYSMKAFFKQRTLRKRWAHLRLPGQERTRCRSKHFVWKCGLDRIVRFRHSNKDDDFRE